MSDSIDVKCEERVMTVTINRPEKKNAITQDMYATMAAALKQYGEDDALRAFVITGEGDMFTAGNDLQDFAIGGQGGKPPVVDFLEAIADCPKPMIAAVNGPGIGVGLTMLLHCDLVYAGQSATLSAPFVNLGVVPEAASSMLLPAAVGMAVANDVLLTGRTLSADEAHQYGLVARVFPDADLRAEVAKIAQGVAASAPTAMRQSKALIRRQKQEVAACMVTEGKIFAEQLQSPEFAESVAAKMQKRAPVFA